MGLKDIRELPLSGRVAVDSAPIIYMLEDHPEFAPRYAPFFRRAENGDYELVISTVTLVEVLSGPLRSGNEALAQSYQSALTTPAGWRVVDLSPRIAYRAARIRGSTRLRLPDAVQIATALETSSIALVTHDRDFSRLVCLTGACAGVWLKSHLRAFWQAAATTCTPSGDDTSNRLCRSFR